MNGSGFRKLYWGVFFIMINFKIIGFDIFPDIAGYILFAFGLSALSSYSEFFSKASSFNIPMIFLSLLTVYQRPVQAGTISFGAVIGVWGIPFAIASIILNLLVFYYIFKGIKDMAERQEQYELANEAGDFWIKYRALQIATLLAVLLFFIPLLAFLYVIILVIISIVIAVRIMGFMNRCYEAFGSYDQQ